MLNQSFTETCIRVHQAGNSFSTKLFKVKHKRVAEEASILFQ